MSGDYDDPEFKLAIELSSLSYEDECRRARPDDLIRFENAEDTVTREKINRIKNLYRQPSLESSLPTGNSIGWGPITNTQSTAIPFSSQPQHLSHSYTNPSLLSNSITYSTFGSSSSKDFSFAANQPGLLPPPRPPKAKYESTSNNPPPLPPRSIGYSNEAEYSSLHRSRIGLQPHPSSGLFPPPSNQRHSASPINLTNLSRGSSLFPVLHTATPQVFELPYSGFSPSSQHSNYDALYVPYTMVSNRLLSGDLIDLGNEEDEEQCSAATLDQIRKEFDPLYRPPGTYERSSNIMPSIHPLSITDRRKSTDDSVAPPVRPRRQSDREQKKENWLTLDNIKLENHEPAILEQVRLLKTRGLNHITTSSLYFKAPIVDYMTTNAASIMLKIQKDHSWPRSNQTEMSMTCEIDTTVEILLEGILAQFLSEEELKNGVPVEKYGLKVYGLDEFLPACSALGHNLYVGKCLLQGQDVKLEIGLYEPASSVNTQSTIGSPSQIVKTDFKYSSILDQEDTENLIVHLKAEMGHYEEAFVSKNTILIAATSNKVRQCVKMLCRLLNSLEPVFLHLHLQNYLTATTSNQLLCARDDFIASIHNFVSVYCQCTMSKYKLEPIRKPPTEVKEIINCTEIMRVMINSLHNLPEEWMRDYSEFFLTVKLFHGTQSLGDHDKCIAKRVKTNAFFPYINLELYVYFKKQKLCMLPRETKIVFLLTGIANPTPNAPIQEELRSKKNLAFVSIPLFDHKMHMRQGLAFLPLTIFKEKVPIIANDDDTKNILKPWGPYPLISNEKDPILIVTLPQYDHKVVFPDVAIEYQSVKQDLSDLDIDTQQYLLDLIESGETSKLQAEDQETLWQKRAYLMNIPEALPLVLASVSDWGYAFLPKVYEILEDWAPLSPVQAMQLLLPQYPDIRVRQKAIEFISKASSDFLFNALPQLVEALRFEMFENSVLAVALLTLSYKDRRFAFEIYWQLQQRIDHCVDFAFTQRCSLLQKELLERHEADHLRNEVARQHALLNNLDCLQMDLRRDDNDSSRMNVLRLRLGNLDGELLRQNVRLPCLPSFKCSGVTVQECSIFNSNAKPLKIVFRGLKSTYSVIHKSGDDMRQDALVLQLVGLMNDIWLGEGLDLKMVTFRCMPVGYRKGMGELVLNCATLCDIQKENGVTGVFRDDVLTNWLVRHNNSEFSYKQAMDNFTRSCAGWVVATYVLGIMDRHNDNILVTKAGHVFHIDFGKYMGDVQTAGGIKRDRVPFVFTIEMYHVINGGNQQKESYQTFIDYCCKAFNYLRRKYTILTNLLKIMACSDIPGIGIGSQQYVESNLMLELSETDAIIQFTELINHSLNSAFPRLNFFIHTLAQVISSAGSSARTNDHTLSFVPQLYTQTTDGKITGVRLMSFEKRSVPNKVYLYKIEVTRATEAVSSVVYRSYNEFSELYIKLRRKFPSVNLPPPSTGTRMRSNVKVVAQRRFVGINSFIETLFRLPNEISHCDLVYTFFHILLRDSNIDSYADNDENAQESNRSQCQVFLKITSNRRSNSLSVFVGHVKHLAMLTTGQAPDAYVKTYVRPDTQNITKRKTQVVKSSQNPTFNKELQYVFTMGDDIIHSRVLSVSVWNNGGLLDNHELYRTSFPLLKLLDKPEDRKANRVWEGWIALEKSKLH